jgi:integrase
MSDGEKSKRQTRRRGNGEGSIFQRSDGRWVATINVGYDQNGKRKRRDVYGATKKEVQDKLTVLHSAKLEGTLVEPSKVNVGQFLDHWLEDGARLSVRANTYTLYKGIVKRHIKPRIGGVNLLKLSPVHVQGLYSEMERDGCSPRLRQLTHAVLHRALKQALKWGNVSRNVCDAVDPPRVPKKTIQPLTPGQAGDLLTAATGQPLHALYVLAITSGLRQGELFALQWADVDLDGKAVTVRHTLIEAQGKIVLSEPKTAKSRRRVSIPKMAVDALHEHRKRMVAEGHAGSPWVFCDRDGSHLRKSNFIRRSFKPLLKAAGLPPIRFHDLRHTSATLLLLQGVHAKVVQERLGHANISMTLDTYSHVLPELEQAAAATFDGLLAKKTAIA